MSDIINIIESRSNLFYFIVDVSATSVAFVEITSDFLRKMSLLRRKVHRTDVTTTEDRKASNISQVSETFDILLAILSSVVGKLSDLKNSPVFLAHPADIEWSLNGTSMKSGEIAMIKMTCTGNHSFCWWHKRSRYCSKLMQLDWYRQWECTVVYIGYHGHCRRAGQKMAPIHLYYGPYWWHDLLTLRGSWLPEISWSSATFLTHDDDGLKGSRTSFHHCSSSLSLLSDVAQLAEYFAVMSFTQLSNTQQMQGLTCQSTHYRSLWGQFYGSDDLTRMVECWSLTGELSLSCTRPAADGWPLTWINRSL